MRRWYFVTLLLSVTLLLGACATVTQKPEVTEVQVRQTLDQATYSGAETKSPYEYFTAKLYYQRALAEKRAGNLKTARDYFLKAYENANRAYENARKFRKSP